MKLKELFIYGIGSGQDGQSTNKFETVWLISDGRDGTDIRFTYVSASTGEMREATFFKDRIAGIAYTQDEDLPQQYRTL